MIELEVKEYAKKEETSLSNVYAKIKRGNLATIKKGGKTYVLIDEPFKQSADNEILKIEIKSLKKELKLLKTLCKSKDSEISTLQKTLSTFSYLFENNFKEIENKKENNDDVILADIEDIGKEKKKKKKKQKRK